MLDFLKEFKRQEESDLIPGLLRDFRFNPVRERVADPDSGNLLFRERTGVIGSGR